VCAKAKPDFKARMAVKLAVAGAFHTDFMAPAVPELEKVRAPPAHAVWMYAEGQAPSAPLT
jgi:malonyl CoA-acyl carrier protein transacylase